MRTYLKRPKPNVQKGSRKEKGTKWTGWEKSHQYRPEGPCHANSGNNEMKDIGEKQKILGSVLNDRLSVPAKKHVGNRGEKT